MSSNCSSTSDCYQTGPHKSTIGETGYSYIQINDYNNNSNNAPIKLPAIYPRPPTHGQQNAINNKVPPAPFDLPDYFQDYSRYNTSQNNYTDSLKKAYPLPNNKCVTHNLTNLNPWTENHVQSLVHRFDLHEFMKNRSYCYRLYGHNQDNWKHKLSLGKLTEILNYNYVFQYYDSDYLKEILKYYICHY